MTGTASDGSVGDGSGTNGPGGSPEPLIPADTPAEHLAAWAATNPELHAEIAAHPNAYPDLVAWIAAQQGPQQAVQPEPIQTQPVQPEPVQPTWVAPTTPAPTATPAKAPGQKRWLLPTAIVASLALVAGGVATAFVLTGDDGEPSAAAQKRAEKRSVLGQPGKEWKVTASDLLGSPDAYFYDPASSGPPEPLAYAFPSSVVVMGSTGGGEGSKGLLVALDPRTGSRLWDREVAESFCAASRDTDGNPVHLFCSDWGTGPRDFTVIDPANGKEVAATTLDHTVDGMLVEDDGGVLTYGTEIQYVEGDSSPKGVALAISHGSLDDLDADWDDVLDDPRTQQDEINHSDVAQLVDQDSTWGITAYGRAWVVDKESGSDRTPRADSSGWSRPLKGGGRLVGATAFDAEGNQVWSAGGQDYVDLSVDHAEVVLDHTDGSYEHLRSEVRDTATGEVLWSTGPGERAFTTSHPGIVLVSIEERTEVRDSRTGTSLWETSTWPMDAKVDTANAVPVWDGDTGEFTMREGRTGEVAWSRDGWETSDEGDYWGPRAASRNGVLVVASNYTVRGFTDFATPKVGPDGSGDGEADGDGGTDYVTACGREPEFEPVTSTARDGGVSIEFVVKAVCPGGQWLSGQQVRLSVNAQDSASSGGVRTLAQGLFDFSGDPVWVPDDSTGTRVRSWFPIGRVWGTEREIQDAIDRKVVVVECIEEDVVDAPAPDPDETDTDGTSEVESVDPGTTTEERDVREENSLDALRRMAAADKQPVLDEIAGQWVPQLSSKQDGTHDDHDAKTYTYTDIYEQHLDLRLRHPSVRLLWSGDWGSFEEANYWVTVAGTTFDKPGGALRWCKREGFAPSQCYAKKVRVSGPTEDTTRHRKD